MNGTKMKSDPNGHEIVGRTIDRYLSGDIDPHDRNLALFYIFALVLEFIFPLMEGYSNVSALDGNAEKLVTLYEETKWD
jgi:hypothetical protein